MSLLQKYISGFSSLLFPAICNGCGETLSPARPVLCRACETDLPRTFFENQQINPVVQTFWGRTQFAFATSVFYYRKAELLQSLIHSLKYRGNKEAGTYLGETAGKHLKNSPLIVSADLIIPVPLHPKKQKIRGYNQAKMISDGIGSVTGLPVNDQSVIRLYHSESQTKRGRYERWQNVEGIFKVMYPSELENKHVLIVDDILTTGATLEAMYHSLATIPGIAISVLTIGFAIG